MNNTYIIRTLILTSFLFMLAEISFGQSKTTRTGYKTGVIKVRKRKIRKAKKPKEEVIIYKDAQNPNILGINRSLNPEGSPKCDSAQWLKNHFNIKGFPDKSRHREYFIDRLNIIDCETAELIYLLEKDTLKIKSKIEWDEATHKFKFSSLENDSNFSLIFDYAVDFETIIDPISYGLSQLKTILVSINLILTVPEKGINYTLLWRIKPDVHSYFPGICKHESDSVYEWISDKPSSKGYKNKIRFLNCSEFEISYENPYKTPKKNGIRTYFLHNKNNVEVIRQTNNFNDKFLSSFVCIDFIGDKMIVTTKNGKLSYSRYKK